MANNLIGFAKKSEVDPSDKNLYLHLSLDAVEHAERYTAADGHDFIKLFIPFEKIKDITEKKREVTGVYQYI